MPASKIEEEYCPKCSTMLDLIKRVKNNDKMIETYYCGHCSQEYDYEYKFKDIIKR
jgi:Zn ribbon nucleic-acid-binding protein